MPCYGCGSEEGTEVRLCQTCIAKRRGDRAQIKSDILTATNESELVYDLMQDTWMKAAVISHGMTICFLFLLFTGPVAQHGPIAAFLFACMVSSSLVSVFIAALFWVRLILNDIMWAIASLIVPCLIYRYVAVNWDQIQVRIFFFVQIGATVLSFLFALLLSQYLNISVVHIWIVFRAYMHGVQVPLTSGEYYFDY